MPWGRFHAQHLQNLRIPIKWLAFRDLLAEDDIKTLTYDVSPSVSEEEAKQQEEDTKLDRDMVDKEESNTEGHGEEDTNTKEHDVEIEEEEGIKKKREARKKISKWL